MVFLDCPLRTAKVTEVENILESFLKALILSFSKFDVWHYDEMLQYKQRFLNINDRFFPPKLHDYVIFLKAHKYWVSLQVTWKMTSWSWPSTLFLTILHQFERMWGLQIRWGRGKEAWEYEIKAGTLKEKMLFLCGFESLFFKGSPPHLLWVWHMVCGTDGCTVIQLLSIWHSCSACVPCQLASSGLGSWNELIPPSCFASESREMLLFTNFPSKPF